MATKKAVPKIGIETDSELLAINAAQEEVIAAQAAEIASLKAKLTAPANIGKGRPVSLAPKTFEHQGHTYNFPAPVFILPNFGRVTAEAALENEEILAALVELINS